MDFKYTVSQSFLNQFISAIIFYGKICNIKTKRQHILFETNELYPVVSVSVWLFHSGTDVQSDRQKSKLQVGDIITLFINLVKFYSSREFNIVKRTCNLISLNISEFIFNNHIQTNLCSTCVLCHIMVMNIF